MFLPAANIRLPRTARESASSRCRTRQIAGEAYRPFGVLARSALVQAWHRRKPTWGREPERRIPSVVPLARDARARLPNPRHTPEPPARLPVPEPHAPGQSSPLDASLLSFLTLAGFLARSGA